MKFAILVCVFFSGSSFAWTLNVSCQDEGNKLVVSETIGKDAVNPKFQPVFNIYIQSNPEENILAPGYTAQEGLFQISPSDTVFMTSKYLNGGKFEVSFADTSGSGGVGHVIYPGTEKVIPLKDCTYSIVQ